MTQTQDKQQATAEEKGASRLEDQVYARLLDSIRLGRFTLGQKLPSENDLATEYGVSRPVIRTALARLREDGLIVSRQGAGSFVSSGLPSEGSGFSPLASVEDIAAYFRFRRFIESETVTRAAARATAQDIRTLNAHIAEMESLVAGGSATLEPDLKFHMKIAELSDNRFLVETMQMLRPHMVFIGKFVRSLGKTGYRIGKRDMSNEHRQIVDALSARDSVAARTAMTAHIDGSERRVFKGE